MEGPTCIITFLGIILDSFRMEIRLPDEKAQELQGLLEQWACRQVCRKRDLLSLIGKLAHACKVIRVGHLFLCKMIDVAAKAKRLDHWMHLTAEFRADLGWWLAFLPTSPPEITIFSDALGSWGCGAIWDSHWLQWEWEGTYMVLPADSHYGISTNHSCMCDLGQQMAGQACAS